VRTFRYIPDSAKEAKVTDLSSFPGRAVVVASPDARMRTRCVAQLAQRGETVVSAADFKTPAIGDALRRSASIAIAEALLPADTTQWREIIEDHGWCGRVLILGTAGSTVDPAAIEMPYLPAPFDIAKLVALL
jgi:hypothetical protein